MLRSLMIWSKQFGSNVCASSSWPKFNKEFPMCVCVCRFPEVRGKECSSAKRARYTSTNTYVRPSFCAPRPSISNVSHLSNSQTYTPKINYIYICMTRIRPLCRTHNTMVWSLGRVNQQQKSAQRKCARFWAAATFRDAISIAKTGARNLCDNPWRQVDGWIFILDAAAQYFYPAHTSSTSAEKNQPPRTTYIFGLICRTSLPSSYVYIVSCNIYSILGPHCEEPRLFVCVCVGAHTKSWSAQRILLVKWIFGKCGVCPALTGLWSEYKWNQQTHYWTIYEIYGSMVHDECWGAWRSESIWDGAALALHPNSMRAQMRSWTKAKCKRHTQVYLTWMVK